MRFGRHPVRKGIIVGFERLHVSLCVGDRASQRSIFSRKGRSIGHLPRSFSNRPDGFPLGLPFRPVGLRRARRLRSTRWTRCVCALRGGFTTEGGRMALDERARKMKRRTRTRKSTGTAADGGESATNGASTRGTTTHARVCFAWMWTCFGTRNCLRIDTTLDVACIRPRPRLERWPQNRWKRAERHRRTGTVWTTPKARRWKSQCCPRGIESAAMGSLGCLNESGGGCTRACDRPRNIPYSWPWCLRSLQH